MGYEIIVKSGELYHHGIAGQKWGVQNGPPYPLSAADHKAVVKSAKKQLNKLDQQRAEQKYQYSKSKRAQTIAERTGDSIKVESEIKKQKELEKSIKDGEKEVQSIIKDLEKNGYEVTTKSIRRNVSNQDPAVAFVMTAATTIGFNALTSMAGIPIRGIIFSGPTEEGTKYKVR
jgi:tRNA G26 N,N-dimethylase Trm1